MLAAGIAGCALSHDDQQAEQAEAAAAKAQESAARAEAAADKALAAANKATEAADHAAKVVEEASREINRVADHLEQLERERDARMHSRWMSRSTAKHAAVIASPSPSPKAPPSR